MTDADVPRSLPLADDEPVVWSGRPRLSAAGPAVLVGLLVATVGVAWWVVPADGMALPLPVAVAAILLGVAIPAVALVSLVNVRYAVTDRAAYVKRGVLGRRVSRARLAMVENTAYRQSVTGSLFGYGVVELETAGTSFAFRRVDDPGAVRAVVDERTGGTGDEEGGIPGSLAEWRAVREEVRALRSAFEG
ncbi:PH domain-containing protein [Halorarum salinum]|uniref:PH domain-containing protein n=1 Tax=Halorarum salinum TaxID=2743089 RepID=A0A7D5LB10_9EURY|nr:PH domain-containing protein [Halobaculum salinum]QLG61795.1 PH domain-containing protein [Halobaculum salinum]